MSGQHVDSFIGKGTLADIRARALRLSKLNDCLFRQLPLSINTEIKLVNIDAYERAIIHVRRGEWATHVRMCQGMILATLKSCGLDTLNGVVIRNRPLQGLTGGYATPKQNRRPMSNSARELVAALASSVPDERLAQSLRRLARKH